MRGLSFAGNCRHCRLLPPSSLCCAFSFLQRRLQRGMRDMRLSRCPASTVSVVHCRHRRRSHTLPLSSNDPQLGKIKITNWLKYACKFNDNYVISEITRSTSQFNFHSLSLLSLLSTTLSPLFRSSLSPLCLRRGQSARCLSSWPPATTLSLAPLSPHPLSLLSASGEGSGYGTRVSPAIFLSHLPSPSPVGFRVRSTHLRRRRHGDFLISGPICLIHSLVATAPPSSSASLVACSCSSQAVGTFRRCPSSCAPPKTQGSKPWRYNGVEENREKEDIKMLVNKLRDIYNDETLDDKNNLQQLFAALLEADTIHFITTPSVAWLILKL
ncbi:hypothetical protein L1049_028010 [Liquidambar formosana]|uniref:Uncharacterized protein n=1 Tax=Liquidambar formosana TaxID=63359 RepID=A0AAP0RIZ7_LIQFO